MLVVSWEQQKTNGDLPVTRWFLLSWAAAALRLSWALCGWATYAIENNQGKVGRGEQRWNSASCRRIGLKANCIDMNKIWSLICPIVSFIKHMICSSREFCPQGSITNMTLHLSYYYCGEYLCFTTFRLLDLFFFPPSVTHIRKKTDDTFNMWQGGLYWKHILDIWIIFEMKSIRQ